MALARAFAVKPDLLVLDEPFVSLDAALAARMRAELVELVSRQPVTTLLVTHSIEEAIEIADRVVLLSAPPARLLGDVRIANPRRNRTAEAFPLSAARSKTRSTPWISRLRAASTKSSPQAADLRVAIST